MIEYIKDLVERDMRYQLLDSFVQGEYLIFRQLILKYPLVSKLCVFLYPVLILVSENLKLLSVLQLNVSLEVHLLRFLLVSIQRV